MPSTGDDASSYAPHKRSATPFLIPYPDWSGRRAEPWPLVNHNSRQLRMIKYCYSDAQVKGALCNAIQNGFKLWADALGYPAGPDSVTIWPGWRLIPVALAKHADLNTATCLDRTEKMVFHNGIPTCLGTLWRSVSIQSWRTARVRLWAGQKTGPG